MGVPQIIMIICFAHNLFKNLEKHGEIRCEKYDFWITVFAVAIESALLWWGGFFS